MARLIPAQSRVLEFGAGRRCLERYLPAGCSHVPSDLVDRGPDTIICDLNRRPLPDLAYVHANVAFFAGVLEYLNNLPEVIAWIAGWGSFCVASYDCAKTRRGTPGRAFEKLRRAGRFGYLSTYSEAELVGVFASQGFNVQACDTWQDQRLFLFRNQKLGLSAPWAQADLALRGCK